MSKPTKIHEPITVPRLCKVLMGWDLLSDDDRKTVVTKENARRLTILKQRPGIQVGDRVVPDQPTPAEIIASFSFTSPSNGEPLTEEVIQEAVAAYLGVPYLKIDPLKLDADLITETLKRAFARRHLVVPVEKQGDKLTVALANPQDLELLENLEQATGYSIQPVVSTKTDILKVITEFYGFRTSVKKAAADLSQGVDLGNLEQFFELKSTDEISHLDSDAQPVVDAVDYMFNQAFDQRASDVHIEPKRSHSQLRLRIDGVLHPIYTLPRGVHNAFISRIKALARMDLAERRLPQDGRVKLQRGEREVEMRISTLPVAFGEKAVIRIFDPEVFLQDLGELGFYAEDMARFEKFVNRPNGMILVTGPTGSGKTTTLYSTLLALASEDVNLVTIEEPVEMVVQEFNQVSVQPKIGLTFDSILRNILRQDPDIIMVGEIRDAETAQYAVQAALTGHLVFSTVHTNDSAAAITRMLELGIAPFLLSSTLIGAVAQRLVRRICDKCKQDVILSAEDLQVLGIRPKDGQVKEITVKVGGGCNSCRGTGYKGRTGLFEVMAVSEKIRGMINRREDAQEMMKASRQDGMMTLRECAVKKMAQGLTTFEEVLRATADT